MKLVAIGDIHGRASWKQAVFDNQDADIFVFIGDYFDTHEDISPSLQIYNFKEIIAWKEQVELEGKKVIMLIGNHDYHYFPEIGYNGTSGYSQSHAAFISDEINKNRKHLSIAYAYENLLFTHAGVGDSFLNKTLALVEPTATIPTTAEGVVVYLTSLWLNKPGEFGFYWNDSSGYGDNINQTPIWIRPGSLKQGSKSLKAAGIIQIVGHTQQKTIDIEGKSTGGKYFFIDALGVGQYLIYNDGKFTTGYISSSKKDAEKSS